jgi:hypothetical protein
MCTKHYQPSALVIGMFSEGVIRLLYEAPNISDGVRRFQQYGAPHISGCVSRLRQYETPHISEASTPIFGYRTSSLKCYHCRWER